MNPVALIALKAVDGGLLVVVFALVGEVLKPKRFAGLFGAAPSVALANLAVIALAEGVGAARSSSTGMAAGGIAMVLCCLVGVPAVRRLGALRGSVVMWGAWLASGAAIYGGLMASLVR